MQGTAAAKRTDYFCRAGSWDYINIRPPHNAQFLSTYRSVRLQFVHLHGTAPISVRVITTSVSLTAEIPFRLQGTHVIPILFWSQFTIDVRLRTHTDPFFSGRSSNGSASMGTDLLFAFLSTAEHRLTRAILERHHARATSELSGRRSSLPFFLTFV